MYHSFRNVILRNNYLFKPLHAWKNGWFLHIESTPGSRKFWKHYQEENVVFQDPHLQTVKHRKANSYSKYYPEMYKGKSFFHFELSQSLFQKRRRYIEFKFFRRLRILSYYKREDSKKYYTCFKASICPIRYNISVRIS